MNRHNPWNDLKTNKSVSTCNQTVVAWIVAHCASRTGQVMDSKVVSGKGGAGAAVRVVCRESSQKKKEAKDPQRGGIDAS